jgi:hypothetical protein
MIGLLRAVLVAVALSGGSAFAVEEAPAPRRVPTPEEIAGWLKKLDSVPEDKSKFTRTVTVVEGPSRRALMEWRSVTEDAILHFVNDPSKNPKARAELMPDVIQWLRGDGAREPCNEKYLRVILEGMRSSNETVKWWILIYLKHYGKHFRVDGYPSIRHAFANDRELQSLPIPVLETLYLSDTVQERLLPDVIKLLSGKSDAIVSAAASTIWAFGIPNRGIKELSTALKNTSDPKTRIQVVQALCTIAPNDPNAVQLILDQIRNKQLYGTDYSTLVRVCGQHGSSITAAKSLYLGLIGEEKWNLRSLSTDEESTQVAAVYALGQLGSESKDTATHLLNYMKATNSGSIYRQIVESLQRIDPVAGAKAQAHQEKKRQEFIESLRRDR